MLLELLNEIDIRVLDSAGISSVIELKISNCQASQGILVSQGKHFWSLLANYLGVLNHVIYHLKNDHQDLAT